MTATTAPMTDPTSIVGKRIGAWVIDLIIFLAIVLAIGAASGGFKFDTYTAPSSSAGTFYCDAWRDTHNGYCQNNNGDVTTFESSSAGNAVWLLHLIAYIVIQGIAGGSLGKLALGLRVVDSEGKQAGIGKSLIRTLLWVVDAITCGIPILGGILLLTTKGHRRVGDMAAGTFVVPKDQMGRPPMQLGTPQGYGAPTAWGGGPGQPVGGGWGAPAGPPAPGTWAPPGAGAPGAPVGGAPGASPFSPPTGPAAPTPTAPTAPTPGDGPQWDAARNAYIQYDRAQGAWVQFDDAAQEWRPISQ